MTLKYQLDSRTACHKLQRISTESHTDKQNMENKYKTRDWRQLGAIVNGKTRDFCEVRPNLNEKTRHSHKAAIIKDCKNAYKSHLTFRKPCSKICKQIHTKHRLSDSWVQKRTKKHETFMMRIHFSTKKHDIPINGSLKTP